MRLPVINFDCKYFEGDKPCFVNKRYGIFCSECNLYEKDDNIFEDFPEIPPTQLEPDNGESKRIIIIKLDAVGDVLRTTSILPSIKDKYPDSEIIWITKQRSFDVLQDNVLIDEIYFDTDDLQPLYNDEYDIAINLDSGHESCTIMNSIIANQRFGYELVNNRSYPVNEFANEWYWMGVDDTFKKANKKTYHQLIHEICGLEYNGAKPSLGVSPAVRNLARQLKEKYDLGYYSEFILINLGGGNRWQYKKWTREGYIDLINRLSINKNICIGVVAGEEDREFYSDIVMLIKDSSNIFEFGTENTIEQFISIVYLADKVFTSDSLCFHIATALEKFVVCIVGPTSHTELDVFGKGKIIYSSKVDCLCCYLNKCDKVVTCMNTVSSESVADLLLEN